MSSAVSQPEPQESVLIHAAYPLWRKHLLMTMARGKELQDNGAQVAITFCNATAGTCAVNLKGSPLACATCRNRVQSTAAENGLEAVPLEVPAKSQLPLSMKREILEGVDSTVTSEIRQLPKDSSRDPVVRTIKRRYFQTSAGLLASMQKLVQSKQPTRIEVFNGRHACSKFAILAAKEAGIPFNTMEITAKGKPILFEGHAAHDRHRVQARMRSLPQNLELAKNWFERRRQPSANRFVKNHSQVFTPPKADGFAKKISVFLSSQDEFESLGRDWRSPFPEFADVVRAACENNPDYLFCVRFHPNQATMSSDVISPFKDIEKLPNAVIYYPLDTISTYALMDWSDIVVTFGSTVTVEACWSGKPAVLLGPSFYDQLDVGYTPASMSEFLSMIRTDLQPRPAENAACLAVYHECEFNTMTYVGHDGQRMVPNGIVLKGAFLSRVARTTNNLFCRAVKSYAKWSGGRPSKAA